MLPFVNQDFGYRKSQRAGGQKIGEIGGWIQRSVTPAHYAARIEPKTFQDRLVAAGTFAVTRAEGGSGVLVGWFHDQSRGWRTPNSLGFRIDGNGGKYWVLFEYGTRHWLTGGGATFEGRYQTTSTKPFLADGSRHRWELRYDPDAADGNGEILFELDGQQFRAPLEPGHKQDGLMVNRFGIWNVQTNGDGLELYLDDLSIDGKGESFDRDPDWEGLGNRVTFEERAIRPLQDFGYSPTGFASGKPGELGGILWRDESPAFYADSIEPCSLRNELTVSGTISFQGAGSDSGMYLGWFNGKRKREKQTPEHEEPQREYLGVLLEGPSRIGHYFRPAYRTLSGLGGAAEEGPILRPDGAKHVFKLQYDPNGGKGNGSITWTLDGQRQVVELAPGEKRDDATLDHFGIWNLQSGGHFVKVYLDDLRYTAGPKRP
ncbi:MAG: hypothetical protein U1D30_25115 [Planctomycetota bacterium]